MLFNNKYNSFLESEITQKIIIKSLLNEWTVIQNQYFNLQIKTYIFISEWQINILKQYKVCIIDLKVSV